jgi:hypothetical protein
MTKIQFITINFITASIFNFSQVRFDANFESGNINTVSTTDSINYNVTTKTDIGGRWFYFRISGVKNKFIKVTVTNSDVKRPFYSYDNINFTRFSSTESPLTNVFQKTYEQDTVYVAYYYPYNYSYLQQRINIWKQSQYVKVDTIGITTRGFPIQEMRITDFSIPDSSKYHVWIHARTHPGETPSSWHFDGMVQKLLEQNEIISEYRKKVVFHCVPFTNPEGVFYGRSRTNYDGVDVESNWNKTDSLTCKEVRILKQRMLQINQQKVISIFQNLHSQAASFCTFWIHTAASTSNLFYKKQIWFANLNTSGNPYFEQSDYSFSTLSLTFPEGWQWANWGEATMALTYETPYYFYSTNILVSNENLKQLGERLVYSIAEMLQLNHSKYLVIDNKNITSQWNVDTSGNMFYSDNYLTTLQSNNKGPAVFLTQNLQRGKYSIYGWWQSNSGYAFDAKFTIEGGGKQKWLQKSQRINGGQWNFLTDIDLSSSGQISISVSDSGTGAIVADAFRIIYQGEPTSVEDETTPSDFILYQNYPNPFNDETIISFKIADTQNVSLKVFDVLGNEITTLLNEVKPSGTYKISFKTQLASGIYFYQLSTKNSIKSKAMILLK